MHKATIKVIIKLIITIICISHAATHLEYNTIAIIALTTLSLSFFTDIVNEKIASICYVIFFAISLFYNELFFAYPIMISAMINSRKIFLLLPVAGIFFTKNFDLLIISLCMLTYFICYFENELTHYKKMIAKKDDKLNLILKHQNKEKLMLIEESKKDVEIAILSERNKISRELHDSIGHTLSGAIIQTEAMKMLADNTLKPQIDMLQANLKRGMIDIRSSLHQLHNSSIDLKLSIENIIAQNENIDFIFKYKINTELSYEAKHNILSIIKEAISNSMKHSDSTKIEIILLEMPKHISINIKDNGSSKNKNIKNGLGFLSFKEFAQKHDGRFTSEFEGGANLMFLLNKNSLLER